MSLVSLVLAAGAGRRFGGNKLAAQFRGDSVLNHALRAACAAPVDRVIVVAAPGLDLGAWQGAPGLEVIRLESDALSASLKAGIAAAVAGGRAVDGVFVFLGDMPLIPHDLAARLAAALEDGFAAVPYNGGQAGHPVLLSARAFAGVALLEGDAGAGKLLRACDDVVAVEVDNPSVLFDIDRPEDLA